jgi:hypothetical protein
MRNRGWVRVFVGCEGPQERHLYSRTNFKLNRADNCIETISSFSFMHRIPI